MNFDEIYAKKIICLDTASEAGTIVGIYIDNTTYDCVGIAVAHTQNYILAAQDIVGKDSYITIANASCLRQPDETLLKVAIQQKVIGRNGKQYGSITDIICGRKNIKIMLSETSFAPYKIVATSNDYVVVNMKNAKPVVYTAANDIDIEVSESADIAAETADIYNPAANTQTAATPQLSHSKPMYDELYIAPPQPTQSYYQTGSSAPDYSFLLGRKVEREITDLTRTFYIAVGTIITDQILTSAKKAGKIAALAINSSKLQG